MCFLKGRTTEKHELSHKVVEISTPSKGHKSWRRRLLGIAARQENGRMWDEPYEPFVFTPRHALIRYDSVICYRWLVCWMERSKESGRGQRKGVEQMPSEGY